MPIRLYHAFHGVIFSCLYLLFSIIYHLAGGTNALDKPYIYDVLDWADPSSAAVYGVLLSVLGPVASWLFLWGLYTLRTSLYRKCHKRDRFIHSEGSKTGEGDKIWNAYGSTDVDDYEV